jgi:hypothetical protein
MDLYLVVAAIHTFKLFEISVVDGLRSDGPDFKFKISFLKIKINIYIKF